MMLNSASLTQARAAKAVEMRAIMSKPNATAEERANFDKLATEVEGIEADLRRVKLLEQAERFAHADPVEGRSGDLVDLERRFSLGKAIAEHSAGRLSGAEAEYSAERRSGRKDAFAVPVSVLLGERRAITTTTPAGGPGSNLVPTAEGAMVDRLRPVLAVEALGATVLPGLTGNLDLPRVKASGSSAWVAEHVAATTTDPQFDKVSLTPKTVTAQYEISRRMMLQAMNLEAVLRADIGYLLAQAIDGAAIRGGGSNEPVGIIGNVSVPVLALGTNGLAMTIDTPADMIGALADANADIGATGFLTNSKVRRAAMKLKDSQNRPYGIGEVFKAEAVTFSNQVPGTLTKGTGTNLSAILYGNWAELIIAYWSAVDVVMNPYADSVASKGGALLHAFLDADVAVKHAESFVVCKDVVA
jgi:HK97 family phage major capsid protein